MARIIYEPSTTFDEWLLEPRETRSEHAIDKIQLKTPLAAFMKGSESRLFLHMPMVSAAMQAVTGPRLAIALAREGGLGFIFCSQPIEKQAEMVSEVKRYKAGFVKSDSNLPPQAPLSQALALSKRTGHGTIAVTRDGSPHGTLDGLLTDNDVWEEFDDVSRPVQEFMTPLARLTYAHKGISLSEANRLLWQKKKSCLPIVDENDRLDSLVFRRDYQHAKENPLQLVDGQKRYCVGAAINTRDYRERVPPLVDAGVDVLVFDSSDGYSQFQKEGLGWVKKHYPAMMVGGGNVIDSSGFAYLAEAGADFVKVGIGGGSICTTREVKALGRGQADAVIEVCKARDDVYARTGRYVPVISDGGIVSDKHIMIALALGADAVMMGRYFAMTDESPAQVREFRGQFFKPYWGEGSNRARNWQRYDAGQAGGDLGFEEGIEGYVPSSGRLANRVSTTLQKLRSLMNNCGVASLEEFHEHAVVRRVSPATLRESQPHDVLHVEMSLEGQD